MKRVPGPQSRNCVLETLWSAEGGMKVRFASWSMFRQTRNFSRCVRSVLSAKATGGIWGRGSRNSSTLNSKTVVIPVSVATVLFQPYGCVSALCVSRRGTRFGIWAWVPTRWIADCRMSCFLQKDFMPLENKCPRSALARDIVACVNFAL
jgi:hypothetical protein